MPKRSANSGATVSGIGAVTAARAGTRRTARTGEFGSSIHCSKRTTEADDIGCTGERVLLRELGKSERESTLRSDIRLSFATHGDYSYHDLRRSLLDKIRVAVIGAGAFGKNHLRVLHESDSAELVAVSRRRFRSGGRGGSPVPMPRRSGCFGTLRADRRGDRRSSDERACRYRVRPTRRRYRCAGRKADRR